MNKKSCAIIAESPMCFSWGYDEEDERCCALKLLLLNRLSLMQANGITCFYIPLDSGIGMYCAEILLSMMEDNKHIELNCLQPFEDQAAKWSPNLRDRYFSILEKCSTSSPVSLHKTQTCELDMMLEAIDHSEIIIGVQAGESIQDKTFATAHRYAQHIGREMQLITAPVLF
jgi:Uncharacterized protein conserved in bacteria